MTPPTPSRNTLAGRTYNDLRNLARRHKRDPAEYITFYALEGFLARLAASDFAKDFVLKGGVLMAVFAKRRPTRDIDLAAQNLSNDVQIVEEQVRRILAVPVKDGLEFDQGSIRGKQIRDDADYNGARVKMMASLATAQVPLHVDVNFGDPIWPAPTETVLPLLLGGSLRVVGYPAHMVLAEKIVTAIERGSINTRWRDFTDIVAIVRTRNISAVDLREAINAVAQNRQVQVEPLGPLIAGMPALAQQKWKNWRKKQRLEESTPADLVDLLEACVAFCDPVLNGSVEYAIWDAAKESWI